MDNRGLVQKRASKVREELEVQVCRFQSLKTEDEKLLVVISQHRPQLAVQQAEQKQLRRYRVGCMAGGSVRLVPAILAAMYHWAVCHIWISDTELSEVWVALVL